MPEGGPCLRGPPLWATEMSPGVIICTAATVELRPGTGLHRTTTRVLQDHINSVGGAYRSSGSTTLVEYGTPSCRGPAPTHGHQREAHAGQANVARTDLWRETHLPTRTRSCSRIRSAGIGIRLRSDREDVRVADQGVSQSPHEHPWPSSCASDYRFRHFEVITELVMTSDLGGESLPVRQVK